VYRYTQVDKMLEAAHKVLPKEAAGGRAVT
jgi:hypothetical protein